jgi:ABC-2 type transport system ATP-binding protein
MLEVQKLEKTFGNIKAVRGVSFKVEKGEIMGFLGPNGAGKSTTMRMITGFLHSNSGTASICGHDINTDAVAAKKCMGYLPENAPLYADMTVTDFLGFIAGIRGFKGAAGTEKVNAVIERCYLGKVRHQSVDTLSKGYKQRVCFAQAVIHDPPVLIMDEPTDGLDPNQKSTVRNMIKTMAKEKAIVISTHILEEVEAICTQAIIISDGTLVAHGTPAELKSRTPSGKLEDVFRELTLGAEEIHHKGH